CSSVRPIGAEWTTATGEQHLIYGYASIFGGLAYIPCVYACFLERRKACYRIMLWLSFIDIIAIACVWIIFGFLLIEGAVFCSHPWLTWIVGCVGLGTWCGA
ncbi:hypothetical protein PMAYCL1PPCAC_03899, partial [Pristionchus mayeri]